MMKEESPKKISPWRGSDQVLSKFFAP
jgi:hypothetical protein